MPFELHSVTNHQAITLENAVCFVPFPSQRIFPKNPSDAHPTTHFRNPPGHTTHRSTAPKDGMTEDPPETSAQHIVATPRAHRPLETPRGETAAEENPGPKTEKNETAAGAAADLPKTERDDRKGEEEPATRDKTKIQPTDNPNNSKRSS